MSDERQYNKISEPITFGKMTSKNRLVMAPMATGFFTPDGIVTQQVLDYYEARAKGGIGMIIVESTSIDFPRGYGPDRSLIDGERTLEGMRKLSAVIRKHNTRAAIQLYHAGRLSSSKFTGFQPLAPSPVPAGDMPHELTVEEIKDIVFLHAKGAERAKEAGFEGIEIHAAHGYLIAQFLSDYTNHRKDKYGGSLENRTRLLIEILRAVRQVVGKDYPLWYRINGIEYGIAEGLKVADVKKIIEMTNHLIDAVHISAEGYPNGSIVEMPDSPGAHLPLVADIKEVAKIPVIAVGRLSPELGEQALMEGKADMIALGRPLICDPDLPNKVFNGRTEDIKPCIACFYCSDVRTPAFFKMVCSVNASAGREGEYKIIPAKVKKRIVIIGSGPAGMECARILVERGHDVTLIEKEGRIGGQLNLAAVPPHKTDRMLPLIKYYEEQIAKGKVHVKLDTRADEAMIDQLKPDIVVIATGANPVTPPIDGATNENAVTAHDVLAGRLRRGNRVVIVGGGSTGLETAEYLASLRKNVTVVEMMADVANGMGSRDRTRLLSKIAALPIKILTSAKCLEIKQDGILISTSEKKEEFIPADTIVLSTGVKPNNSLYTSIRAMGYETVLIGDSWHIGKLANAIFDGLRIGCLL